MTDRIKRFKETKKIKFFANCQPKYIKGTRLVCMSVEFYDTSISLFFTKLN